jgi:hypothetical protein
MREGERAMDHEHIAELNKRLAAMQRTLARTHNSIIFGAAGSMVTAFMSVIAVAHYLEWSKWAVIVPAVIGIGALNLFAAKTLKKDGLDDF